MKTGRIDPEQLGAYERSLREEERSASTVEKYCRDAWAFYRWLPAPKQVTKEAVVAYKRCLMEQYAVRSVNSMLAAVNHLLRFLDLEECAVRAVRTQRRAFCQPEEELTKEEYRRLLAEAKGKCNWRLCLIMEAMCSTGIRVSELKFITVEAVRLGRADVDCKGKVRTILLPRRLCEQIRRYIRWYHLSAGPVFITRGGRPVDRSNVWSDMKKLCSRAGVDARKVFPHNLRHLFARTFYAREKDLGRLADLLGHSSVETTRIYTMTSGQEHRETLELLDLLFPSKGA